MTLTPSLTFTDYEWFPWRICNGCGMPAGNAYPSGHLVPSPIVRLACAPIVETRFLELAMSLLDFSPRIPLGTFSIFLALPIYVTLIWGELSVYFVDYEWNIKYNRVTRLYNTINLNSECFVVSTLCSHRTNIWFLCTTFVFMQLSFISKNNIQKLKKYHIISSVHLSHLNFFAKAKYTPKT